MDFAQQQRNPGKHLVGISIVVLMHIILIYALVTGLARKVVEVIKQPLETKIIEEIKEKPPEEAPPPPKLDVPPPPFIPPPEVNIQAPAVAGPTITTVTHVKPVAPPPPAPVVAPKPAIRKGMSPVYKVEFVYPRKALQEGIEGNVVAYAYVAKDGTVKDVKIIKQDRQGYFEKEVTRALMQWRFTPDESDYVVEVPFSFKLAD